MKNRTISFKGWGPSSLVLVLSAVMLCVAGCSTTSKESTASSESKAQLMFVQSADDLTVDSTRKTFRLVNVNQQTLYFSDRPVRIAGHYTMADYLDTWREGKDNFGEDPPNATLSVYEPDKQQQTMAVIEITNPVVDGADLVYTYQLIEGVMPPSGGATALFIDWVGAGGGVGVLASAGRAASDGKRTDLCDTDHFAGRQRFW